MPRLTPSAALDILHRARVPADSNFHRLNSGDVCALLDEADAMRYRAPRNANGSRARYFHAFLARTAASRKES